METIRPRTHTAAVADLPMKTLTAPISRTPVSMAILVRAQVPTGEGASNEDNSRLQQQTGRSKRCV